MGGGGGGLADMAAANAKSLKDVDWDKVYLPRILLLSGVSLTGIKSTFLVNPLVIRCVTDWDKVYLPRILLLSGVSLTGIKSTFLVSSCYPVCH